MIAHCRWQSLTEARAPDSSPELLGGSLSSPNSSSPPPPLVQSQGMLSPKAHIGHLGIFSTFFCPPREIHAQYSQFYYPILSAYNPSCSPLPVLSSATTVSHMNYCSSLLTSVSASALPTLPILHIDAKKIFVMH